MLGSKSGFDSVEECYGDLAPHIFAVETGLSSDPPMNWRVSSLDRFTLVSNSDAHSPPMLGREACAFDTDLDYFAIRRALETGEGYGGTVEFFPEEGKYHLDGHRACGVRLEPAGDAAPRRALPGLRQAADRGRDAPGGGAGGPSRGGAGRRGPIPFRCLVPLPEVLAEIHGVGAEVPRRGAGARASSSAGWVRRSTSWSACPWRRWRGRETRLLLEALDPPARRQGPPRRGVRRRVRGDPAVRARRDPWRGRGGAAVRRPCTPRRLRLGGPARRPTPPATQREETARATQLSLLRQPGSR